MQWHDEHLRTVDAAVSAAANGRPTLLMIDGEPGQGKSSLLRETVARATWSHILFGSGEHDHDEPFSLLASWNTIEPSVAQTPFQVAQKFRNLVEKHQHNGPVLIAIDDLHLIDRESIETVIWLLRSASCDCLLVAAAVQPKRKQTEWNRLLLNHGSVFTVHLTGLSREMTHKLVIASNPDTDATTSDRLYEHTGGNPLYLRTVLREYSAAALADAVDLPVPTDLASAIHSRVEALDSDATALLQAIAVLGTSWSAMALATELADVSAPTKSMDTLVATGFVQYRSAGADADVRIKHVIVGAAIYSDIPLSARHRLHLRASQLLPSPAAALRHRVSAAERYDEKLAQDLTRYAADLHKNKYYRDAGKYLQWSSSATANPVRREQLWLDSLFNLLLARDVAEVKNQLGEVAWARDSVRRALVQGLAMVIDKRWAEAVRLLDDIPESELGQIEEYVLFRVRTLQSWTRLVTGTSGAEVLPIAEEAMGLAHSDPSLSGYLMFAYGQAQMDSVQPGSLMGFSDSEPTPHPPSDVYLSAWRGSVYALSGLPNEAVRHLELFTACVGEGSIDVGDGVFHALLGFALWMRGDWRRAHVSIEIALSAQFGADHPMVLAIVPLLSLANNDRDATRTALTAARDSLLRAPWRRGIEAATIVEVLALHLFGDEEERRTYFARSRALFGDATSSGVVPPLWMLHSGIAAAWAGDFRAATAMVDRLEEAPLDLRWRLAATGWIRGLVEESRGDIDSACEFLHRAHTDQMSDLPVHGALLSLDLERVARAAGKVNTASAAGAAAKTTFKLLGASTFGTSSTSSAALATLSEREKDVVALLSEGLSYAQIARELFVTRSTVAFHLSKVYAKTNTATRHQLIQLIRSN